MLPFETSWINVKVEVKVLEVNQMILLKIKEQ